MRRLITVLLTSAFAVTVPVMAPSSAVAVAVPAPPTTAYTIDQEPGPLDYGGPWVAGADVNGYPIDNGLQVSGTSASGSSSHTSITATTAGPMEVGSYDMADSRDGTHVGVSMLFPSGVQCTGITGTLEVHDIGYDQAGQVTRFAGSSRTSCDGGESWVAQEFRWATSIPLVRKVTTAGTWTQEPVTFTVPEATTFGTARISGGEGNVQIGDDTCSGQSVAAGASCTVTVRGFAHVLGPIQAKLTLPEAADGPAPRVVPFTVVGTETKEGGYASLKPARLLDTRRKVGVTTTTPLGAGSTATLQVLGRGGVPGAGVRAVVLNLTAVSPTSQGYLTAYPYGQTKPTASSINFDRGWTGANLVTVGVGPGGKVNIYNYAGSTHVVADVMGFYTASNYAKTDYNGYFPDPEPFRAVDTRSADWGSTPLGPDEYLWQGLDYGDEYNHLIKAFAVNITVTKPTGTGYLSAWNGDENAIPSTSSLNFTKGRTVPNMQIVPASQVYIPSLGYSIPRFGVINRSNGSGHVIVDVVGVYADNTVTDGLRFTRLDSPKRIVDTRKGQGTSPIGSNVTKTVLAPSPVAGYNTVALVTNTTAVKPTIGTVLTLWASDGTPKPGVSNLNPYASQLVSNMTMTAVGEGNLFKVHNLVGTTNLVVDVAGTMEFYPAYLEPGVTAGAKAGQRLSATPERPTTRVLDATRVGAHRDTAP